jgi:hypothetical protein
MKSFRNIPVSFAPDDRWKYHPKHVEQFPDINKLCNVACCWIYEYTGIVLGVHYILHINRIRVNTKKLLQFGCIFEKYNLTLHVTTSVF